MKKPPFAREIDAERIESALLGSFDDDEPPRGAKLAAMAALGAGVAHGSIVSGAVSGFTRAGIGARTAAMTASKTTALVALKWFGVGILGGTAVVGPLELVNRHRASLQETTAALVPSATPRTARSEWPTPIPAAIDLSSEKPAELLRPAARAPLSRGLSPQGELLARDRGSAAPAPPAALPMSEPWAGAPVASASAPRPPPLAGEIAWLDGARRALAAGQPALAVSLLDHYDREFDSGALRPEAIVLRVEALVKAGDGAGAAALARRSVATLPETYGEKIRLLLSP
jgi:hypothetical protein